MVQQFWDLVQIVKKAFGFLGCMSTKLGIVCQASMSKTCVWKVELPRILPRRMGLEVAWHVLHLKLEWSNGPRKLLFPKQGGSRGQGPAPVTSAQFIPSVYKFACFTCSPFLWCSGGTLVVLCVSLCTPFTETVQPFSAPCPTQRRGGGGGSGISWTSGDLGWIQDLQILSLGSSVNFAVSQNSHLLSLLFPLQMFVTPDTTFWFLLVLCFGLLVHRSPQGTCPTKQLRLLATAPQAPKRKCNFPHNSPQFGRVHTLRVKRANFRANFASLVLIWYSIKTHTNLHTDAETP